MDGDDYRSRTGGGCRHRTLPPDSLTGDKGGTGGTSFPGTGDLLLSYFLSDTGPKQEKLECESIRFDIRNKRISFTLKTEPSFKTKISKGSFELGQVLKETFKSKY